MIESKEITNPFPGLRPFETDEYRLFFGREGQSDELIARLQRSHFLAVVGTSGSGKSSLVRAGLLPALRGGMMTGAGSGWRIAIMRPGSDPIGNLALTLAEKDVLSEAGGGLPPAEAEAVIEATLRRGSLGLVDVVSQARLSEHEKLLVVVDQFEELFRFRNTRAATRTKDDASAFVKLLLEAARQHELSIYVVPTMRSDFLGDCAQFQGLPEAINDGQYLIPRMSRDERRFAITGPVGVKRRKITEPLVNRLLNDVGDNPDQLPILQHALMRTWDHWSAHRRNGEPIGLEHYEAIGTMSDALSQHADEAFNELPDERSQSISGKLFKALTERGADNREIRRPTSLGSICEIAGASLPEVAAVIEVFRGGGRSFLMPPAGVALRPETVIDISHESLIRNWDRLQVWVDEEAQSARIYRRLAEAAVLHREGSEGLLQDPGLQIALDWRERSKPTAAWAERYHPDFEESIAYLDQSRRAREAAQAEKEQQRNADLEREKRERELAEIYAAGQAKAARRLRLYLVAVVVLALFALAGTAFAVAALVKARHDESAAEDARWQAEQATRRETESLHNEMAARTDAVEQKRRAEDEKKYAEDQKKLADTRATEAEQARKQAVASAAAAVIAQKAAEREATRNSKAKKANDFFREAALYVQRGKYQDAKDYFSSAIEGYQDPDVANDEGIADATVEIGNLALAVGRQTFSRTHDFTMNNVMGNLDLSIGKYDEAARIYAQPKVGALDKAAATNFSLAMNLLPFTNGTIAGAPIEQAAAGWNGAEGELPMFTIGAYVGSGPFLQVALNYDPIGKLKNTTVKHLQVSLGQYRQVFEEHKNISGDWRTEASRAGMRKAAYQLGQFFVKQGNEESTNRAYKKEIDRQKAVNYERRQAIHYFEDLLSTYETNDVERGRLLIWLGGLHKSLGNSDNSGGDLEIGDKYFERVYVALRQLNSSEADALALIAEVLDENGQGLEAVDFYQKSGLVQESRVRKADMYFNRGRVYEKLLDFGLATNCYSYGLGVYQKAFEEDQAEISPSSLFTMGSFFKQTGDDNNALAAFDLVIRTNAKFKHEYFQMYVARAYTETGAILSKQNKPREALAAYRNALTMFDELAKAPDGSNEWKTQANAEAQRVRVIVSALESTVR